VLLVSRFKLKLRRALIGALAAGLVGISGVVPATASINNSPALGSWGVNGRVWSILRIGHVAYLGGEFSAAIGPTGQRVPRDNLAAIDTRTGRLTQWSPNANGPVYALAQRNGTIFIGGDFSRVKGTVRNNFAAVKTGGSLLRLRVNAGALVRSLAVMGSKLYLGGRFGRVNGAHRAHLASIDLAHGGRLTSWHPSVNLAVRTMQPLPSGQLVIGGVFTRVNGRAQRYLAIFRKDGSLGQWEDHPDPDRWVEDIAEHDGLIAVAEAGQGGRVQAFNYQGRERWRIFCNGDVQAVGIADNRIIAGGHFLTADQLAYPRLVALSMQGEVVRSWRPAPDKPVWALRGTGSGLLVGGEFLHLKLDSRTIGVRRFAQFKVA
jgi:hypothetical protein